MVRLHTHYLIHFALTFLRLRTRKVTVDVYLHAPDAFTTPPSLPDVWTGLLLPNTTPLPDVATVTYGLFYRVGLFTALPLPGSRMDLLWLV